MKKQFPPLEIKDLLRESGKDMTAIIAREKEAEHMARVVERMQHNNLLLIGKRGIGKTTVIRKFSRAMMEEEFRNVQPKPYIELVTATLVRMIRSAGSLTAALEHCKAAFESLPACVMVIDDIETLLDVILEQWQFTDLFSPFITDTNKHLFLVLEEELYPAFKENYGRSLKTFDRLLVTQLDTASLKKVINQKADQIRQDIGISLESPAIDSLFEASKQVPSERAEPDRSLRFLDEVVAAARIKGLKTISQADIQQVVFGRLGMPVLQTGAVLKRKIKTLHETIRKQLIGQDQATGIVANSMQRSLLGLKNPNRPRGSFLFLGPSGVGKTELAKVLAKEVYGSEKAFIRIDMSEFSDAHTSQRLIGPPPGYVGYEAGGQLTNPVLEQPFSLILLDEIEKAHPAIFDIFLQVLDDGRLSDGQGRLVDFSKATIIATSNIGISEIVKHWQQGVDVQSSAFLQNTLLPLMRRIFRLEFINRFDALAVFSPLDTPALVEVAKLELRKIEQRLAQHNISINLPEEELEIYAKQFSDPHLGARPLKRFLEEKCESILAEHLMRMEEIV